jgi:hypothetical protein
MSWESMHGHPAASLNRSVAELPALIAAKEQELRDINDYRLQSLERLLLEKENESRELKANIARIKEDFAYNLSVRFSEDRGVA